MTSFKTYLTATAVLGAVCAPAAAQTADPDAYSYQQQYQQPNAQPAYQPYGYNQGYGYNQNYGYNPGYAYNQGTGNPVTDIIDSLLGNRYNVTDRQAARQCANAAMAQADQRYGGYRYNRGGMRVSSITEVQRRGNGLRVSGTMSQGPAYASQNGYQNGNGYGDDRQYGQQNRQYAGAVSFRCNVAYNGAVTGIRIRGY